MSRRKRQHLMCCPFHKERTPSFSMWNDGSFVCFGCNTVGSWKHVGDGGEVSFLPKGYAIPKKVTVEAMN